MWKRWKEWRRIRRVRAWAILAAGPKSRPVFDRMIRLHRYVGRDPVPDILAWVELGDLTRLGSSNYSAHTLKYLRGVGDDPGKK